MVYICYGSLVNVSASVGNYDVRRLATNFRQQGEQGAVEISLRIFFLGGLMHHLMEGVGDFPSQAY
jgi:hypothetical protein